VLGRLGRVAWPGAKLALCARFTLCGGERGEPAQLLTALRALFPAWYLIGVLALAAAALARLSH
jgi:hypothetical protein